MGYSPPPPPPRLNLDRFGLPKDYATYVWIVYKRHVADDSPARRAFLHREDGLTFGLQVSRR
jgi:hypothetical protein